MIKLIASDVDGTLIKDSTPDLYPEMVDTIRELKKKGILFCAASGRQYGSLRNVFREVADDVAYIAENGAYICYRDKDISVTPMKREHIEGIVDMLRSYYGECDIVVSTPAGSLIESKNKEFLDLMTYGYHNTYRQVEDVLKEKTEIIKVAVYRKDSIRDLGDRIFIPAWKNKVKVCMAGEEWVDFMDAGVDKGNALRILENYLGIEKRETIAFGDNDNDIGMMLAAGCGYAVDTAVLEVRQAADRICPGWRQKGVCQVIRKEVLEDAG